MTDVINCSNRWDVGCVAIGLWAFGIFVRKSKISWRTMFAGFAAIALVLQGLSFYEPRQHALSAAEAAYAVLTDLPGAASAGAILCLNSDEDLNGKAPVHNHGSGSCPICQIIGFSLDGAPGAEPLVLPMWCMSQVVTVPARDAAPLAPARISGRPRAPPAIV